jgi:O-antigen/teichoic acid export membrane protein
MIFAFIAQIVSIIVSLVMTLGIPKILSLDQYGFWQLFIFYTGFIGFFQFGLSDGIYLRYGGKDFKDLNKRTIKSQMVYGFCFQLIISIVIIVIVSLSNIERTRYIVIISTAIYLVIGNVITLLGFLLLATNNIKYYSKAVLLEKLSFIAILSLIFFSKKVSYLHLIELFLFTKLLSLTFLLIYFKNYRTISLFNLKKSISFLKINMSFGIVLMLSNIASTLIIGIGRFAIDNKWDIETFGKISLSLSATYFFLLLISQISLSLFPVLRQLNYENQRSVFIKSCDFLGIFMLGIFILYFPLISFLKIWLPKYVDSLSYMIILMPICLFEGKMQMIHNTYMKSLNKQKMLLFINLSILAISLILTYINGYIFHNLLQVIYTMLICISLRSIFTQLYLYKYYRINFDYQIVMEVLFTVLFIYAVTYLRNIAAIIIYISCYSLYLILIRKKCSNMLHFLLSKKNFVV